MSTESNLKAVFLLVLTVTGLCRSVAAPSSSDGPQDTLKTQVRKRIVGGQETGAYDYKFAAYLRYRGSRFCGGSIISHHHILTAAHCLDNLSTQELQVVVGGLMGSAGSQTINVQKTYTHPYYKKFYMEEIFNDIAILELVDYIRFNEKVGMVFIPLGGYNLIQQEVTALGWGIINGESQISETLERVNVIVMAWKRCLHYYPKLKGKSGYLCTFAPERGTCKGDSGGPVVHYDPEQNLYIQVGIVSFGAKCGGIWPSVNTETSSFGDWIQDVVSRYSGPQGKENICRKLLKNGSGGKAADDGFDYGDELSQMEKNNANIFKLLKEDLDYEYFLKQQSSGKLHNPRGI